MNSCHLQQLSSIHWCIYAWLMSYLHLKGASPCTWSHLRLALIIRAAHCWLHHLSVLSVPSVALSAFHQWRIPTLHLPVWGLPHQSQSHLNTLHSPPASQYSYRALCISQLQFRCRHYSSQSWSASWLIQTLGCWSSNCYTLYIWTPLPILQKVTGMLATSHPSGRGI